MVPLPKTSEEQAIAILRTPDILQFAIFTPQKVKVVDLKGAARLPDIIWTTELGTNGAKWLGLGLEAGLLYAWSEDGKIELWGLPERGVDTIKGEPVWTFRGTAHVEVPMGLKVSVAKPQAYRTLGMRETVTLGVGYATEAGEVEVFDASIISEKELQTTKVPSLKLVSLYKTKAPKRNALKLPTPGGVTAICWLATPISTTTITTPRGNRYARSQLQDTGRRLFFATGTSTGEIRLYDTHISRRPFFREEVLPRGGAAALRRGVGTDATTAAGSSALVCLQNINPPPFEVRTDSTSISFIFSNESAKFGIYTVKCMSSMGKEWKGKTTQVLDGNVTGIVRGVGVHHHHSQVDQTNGILLASVGLDRYLHIYRGNPGAGKDWPPRMEVISRAYVHTRGTHVAWIGDVGGDVWETEEHRKEREKDERRKYRERDMEEVWEGIGVGINEGLEKMGEGEEGEQNEEEELSEEASGEESSDDGVEYDDDKEEQTIPTAALLLPAKRRSTDHRSAASSSPVLAAAKRARVKG